MFFQVFHDDPDFLNQRHTGFRKAELQERRFFFDETSPLIVQLCKLRGPGYPAETPSAVEVLFRPDRRCCHRAEGQSGIYLRRHYRWLRRRQVAQK